MALTAARVPHSGVLPDLAGQRPLTGPWFPGGAAPRPAGGVYPGRRAGAGRSAGQARPLRPPAAARPNPAPPRLAQVAASAGPRRFPANRAAS